MRKKGTTGGFACWLKMGVDFMTMTDPVADMLTRIRNAAQARHEMVEVPASKLKIDIARILKEEGYVSAYTLSDVGKKVVIRIQLRYSTGKKPVISSLERVSRPGCRVYANKSEIPEVLGGMGICILSTSQGLMTGKQAQEKKLGGEILCAIS
jgi:small subunit ribosomal protein S8